MSFYFMALGVQIADQMGSAMKFTAEMAKQMTDAIRMMAEVDARLAVGRSSLMIV